jgi:triosephosphate isomerase
MAMSMPSARGRSARRPPSRTSAPPLGSPLFLLNLKNYANCLGDDAESLARALAAEGAAAGVSVAIAPSTPDLARVSRVARVAVLAQHVDPDEPGAHTGAIVAEAVRAAGARGSLVNHSERPVAESVARRIMGRLRATDLTGVVCARDARTARRLASLAPPYLAVEPPELIGGNRSVATAAPEVIAATVDAVRSVSPSTVVLCGAGIHRREDVARAIELGSQGILVASAVTTASDPRAKMHELLAGFPLPGRESGRRKTF